jgi:hypothetical protein
MFLFINFHDGCIYEQKHLQSFLWLLGVYEPTYIEIDPFLTTVQPEEFFHRDSHASDRRPSVPRDVYDTCRDR